MNNGFSMVEITVCNLKGEPLENQLVKMYDDVTYEAFKKDQTVKALLEMTTNQEGKANFILENQRWFAGGNSKELMFVVLNMRDVSNYEWWSMGGTVTIGKKCFFKIEVDTQNIAQDKDVKPESPFLIEDGVLMGMKDPSLTQVVLPAEVKSIAPGAFWESNVESLVLNEGLESIGVQAFARSTKLASVTFPSSLKVIGKHAFEDCVALTKLNLSKTKVEEIGSNAFRETGLKEVAFPVSLKKIGSQAFLKTQLENVVLPEGVQEIGNEAFREVVTLKSITLSNNIQKVGERAFYTCEKLEKVNYVGQVKWAEGILERAAFEGCRSLTTIILPQSIAELQEGIFMECSNLKEIILTKFVRKIKDYGLRTNYKLERIRFEGDEAPEIGNYSLPFLESIMEIIVPKGKSDIYKAKYPDYQSIIRENP